VEGLIESELFGHRKGSFTGALSDKGGLFEAAGQGTMFLDEIGEMPLSFQPHFLRVLQDGEFRSVGGNTVSRAHCRIITATNRDLYLEVKEGRFRDDLYYRVSAITINVPPLRDRKEDISFLSRVMIERFSARTGKTINGLSRPAMQALLSHQWPGNVRELENVLEQAAILTTETFIKLEDLPPHIREKSDDVTEKIMTLEEVTRKHIEEVLKKNNGNRSHAAKFLGISRRALIRKIEKYSL
jgi:transcriptional regulator with PAS, ATPase and Fis domain